MSSANRNFVIFCYLAVFLILFAGLRPVGFDFDSPSYSSLLNESNLSIEPSFIFLRSIANLLFSNHESIVRFVFFSYAFLNITILSRALVRLVRFNNVSIFLFFLLAYAMLTLTQIRFGLAVAIFIWALSDLAADKRIKFSIKILIAASCHYSLIMALPLLLLSVRKFNVKFYALLPLLLGSLMLFDDRLLLLIIGNLDLFSSYLSSKLSIYVKDASSTSLPIFNVLSIFIITVYYLSLIVLKETENEKLITVMKVSGWCLGMYFAMGFIEVVSKRFLFTLSVLISIIAPLVADGIKQKNIIKLLFILYSIFYFFNMTVRHELLDYSLYYAKGFT